jgi:CHASE3 domain sensor protein
VVQGNGEGDGKEGEVKYFPTLNVNGTSYEELVRQHTKIITGLSCVLNAMSEAVPHGRDYTHVGHRTTAEIFHTAQSEHSDRFWKIRKIMKEYEESLEHIQSLQRKRECAK